MCLHCDHSPFHCTCKDLRHFVPSSTYERIHYERSEEYQQRKREENDRRKEREECEKNRWLLPDGSIRITVGMLLEAETPDDYQALLNLSKIASSAPKKD